MSKQKSGYLTSCQRNVAIQLLTYLVCYEFQRFEAVPLGTKYKLSIGRWLVIPMGRFDDLSVRTKPM